MNNRSLDTVLRISSALALAVPAIANVRIVAPSGGEFANVQAAINAATDGDTILVKNGTYAGFTIDAHAFVVCADAGAVVAVTGTTTVKNLAAGQTVVLSGLHGTGTTQNTLALAPGTGLLLQNNAGAVRVQTCDFTGANGFGDNGTGSGPYDCNLPGHDDGWDGARIENSPAGAEFSACTLRGGRAAWANNYCIGGTGSPGGDGLYVLGSQAALYDCALIGGRGGDNGDLGGVGGFGLSTLASSYPCGVFASGTNFQGGRGGDGYDYISSNGGDGGSGYGIGASTSLQLLACVMNGGTGGLACGGLFPPGADGQPGVSSGSVFTFNVPKLKLSGPTVVRELTDMNLSIEGAPGDLVRLFMQRAPHFQPIPSWRGVLLTENSPHPTQSMIVGEIPLSGTLNVTLSLPDLGAGVQARTVFMQAWRLDAQSTKTLGSLLTFTTLDSAF